MLHAVTPYQPQAIVVKAAWLERDRSDGADYHPGLWTVANQGIIIFTRYCGAVYTLQPGTCFDKKWSVLNS